MAMDKILIFVASFAALILGFAMQADASLPKNYNLDDSVGAAVLVAADHSHTKIVRGDLYRKIKWSKLPAADYF